MADKEAPPRLRAIDDSPNPIAFQVCDFREEMTKDDFLGD
jgi:hypothetical protein